ncbi:MAG TPA: ABC transporter C-terminal domain-containing protein, partial [Novosphingobium sp.]|nr:ABC transporter C-terminal domain-containing protein [Novosphingobium sp.]
ADTEKMKSITGGYAAGKERPRKASGPAKAKPAATAQQAPPAAMPPRKAKLSYKDQRDYELLPARIAELEAGIARDEAALADPSLYSRDPARFAALTAALDKARAEKDAAEERWLELAELIEG